MTDPDFKLCTEEILEILNIKCTKDQFLDVKDYLFWIWLKGRGRGREQISEYYVNKYLKDEK